MYAHELFEQNKPRVVVTYPGRFQPWHSGHSGVFSQLQKKFGAENVFIATSNDQSSAKSPFNFSDKYQLMTAAGVPADKIIQTNAMYALPEGIDPLNTIFITAVGAPDADRLNPDTVLKRDKKDKSGNIVKPAGSPGYYKIYDATHDSLTADQHGYVIVIPEIKKSIRIGGQTYDVSHGTETRNLWNAVRDDEKSRLEFLSQLYGRPSSELANIFDKIPQTAKEDIAPGSSDSTSPIHGGQIYEQVVTEAARVARKPGQPAGSKKHSDLYTDENPKGTITGLKFATVEDARASVSKIRSSGRSHAHKIQAAVAMEQRARAAGKASAAAVYRKYINANKKTESVNQGVVEDKEKNHWYDAGVKDATRGARPNPRTYLPTLKDKQAKHPEEVDFYMNGYKSVPQGVAEGSKMLSLDDKIKIYSKHKSQAQQAENRGDYTTADKHKKQASRIYSNIVNLHFGDDGKDAQNAANEYIRKSQGVAEGSDSETNYDGNLLVSLIQNYTPQSYAGKLIKQDLNDPDSLPFHLADVVGLIDEIFYESLENGSEGVVLPDEKQDLRFFYQAAKKSKKQVVAEGPEHDEDVRHIIYFRGTDISSFKDNIEKVIAIQKSLRKAHSNKLYDISGSRETGNGYVTLKHKSDAEAIKAHIKKAGGKVVAVKTMAGGYHYRPKDKEQVVAEGWSQKYKRSINCSHPKGFSQKAHCAG